MEFEFLNDRNAHDFQAIISYGLITRVVKQTFLSSKFNLSNQLIYFTKSV